MLDSARRYPNKDTPEFAKNEEAKKVAAEVLLYDGPVRKLCGIFPRNVNTIATAAICARKTVGMNTRAVLVADSFCNDFQSEIT